MKSIIKKIFPLKVLLFFNRLVNGNYYYYLWLFPIKANKIVICNYFGKGYGDNAKYIVDKLIEKRVDCEIVWLLDKKIKNKVQFPEFIRTVNYKSLRGLYELATAKVWIDNSRKVYYPPKRKTQFYVQTWHAGIALKKVEKDVETKLSGIYVESAKRDSRIADLFISNSKFCTKLYQSSFWYKGEILECGSPRCDILINRNNEVVEKVKRYFNMRSDTSILIYAPTFRADSSIKAYDIDLEQLIKLLEKKFGGKWNILVRLHPNISSKSDFMIYTSTIMNATHYDDMYELLVASDILVTDYSSTMFEFSFLKRPVFLYAPDIKSYSKDRNFYFDISTLPYPIAEDNKQLVEVLSQFDLNSYVNAVNSFLSKLGISEQGNASTQVVDKIIQFISN